VLAVSRLYLDNFPTFRSPRWSPRQRPGQVAAVLGADDFGGTLFEENVPQTRRADFVNKTSVTDCDH